MAWALRHGSGRGGGARNEPEGGLKPTFVCLQLTQDGLRLGLPGADGDPSPAAVGTVPPWVIMHRQ
jgi:hypothetical protein